MNLQKRSPARVDARNRAESPSRNFPATRNRRGMEDFCAKERVPNRDGAPHCRILQPQEGYRTPGGA